MASSSSPFLDRGIASSIHKSNSRENDVLYSPLTNFHFFSSLPLELQLLIFTFALPPRIITLDWDPQTLLPYTRTLTPSLLQVNHLSRTIALKHYIPLLTPSSDLPTIYISPRHDTLHLSAPPLSVRRTRPVKPYLSTFFASLSPALVLQQRHLSLDRRLWCTIWSRSCFPLHSLHSGLPLLQFRQLETLTMRICYGLDPSELRRGKAPEDVMEGLEIVAGWSSCFDVGASGTERGRGEEGLFARLKFAKKFTAQLDALKGLDRGREGRMNEMGEMVRRDLEVLALRDEEWSCPEVLVQAVVLDKQE